MAKKRKTKKTPLIAKAMSEDDYLNKECALTPYASTISELSNKTFSEIVDPMKPGDRVAYKTVGMVVGIVESIATGDTKPMGFLSIYDLDSVYSVVLSKKAWPVNKNKVKLGGLLYISGTIVSQGESVFIAPDNIEEFPRSVNIPIESNDPLIESLKRVSERNDRRARGNELHSKVVALGETLDGGLGDDFVGEISRKVNRQLGLTEADLDAIVGTNLKGYMNSFEIKDFMWILLTAGYGDFYRAQAVEHGNITKEEFDALTDAINSIRQYTSLKLARTEEKTKKRIEKKAYSGEIKFFDKDTIDRLRKSSEDVMADVLVEREEFEELAEMLMRQHCKNCTMLQADCKLNDILYDALIPESGHNCSNCPYAYNDHNSSQRINDYILQLRNIRRDRSASASRVKSDSLSREFMQDIVAINKAIEALLELKNSDSEGTENE